MGTRAQALAERLEHNADELVAFIEGCSEQDWQTQVPSEGRSVGVVAHHVASVYGLEMHLSKTLATEKGISGVTMDMVNKGNAEHAAANASCTREETIKLLKKNSAEATAAIREMSNEELDQYGPVSLHGDATLSAQYFIEDHPVNHSFVHLAAIQATLEA